MCKIPSAFLDRKDRKVNIEIYPGTSNSHSLPLARERTMLLDQPLELVEQRGRLVQDVAGYISWLKDPKRSYMAKNDMFRYVVERLDFSCLSSLSVPKQEPKEPKEQKKPVEEHVAAPASTEKPVFLKNRTRGAIVGYWLRGEKDLFRHLNGAILVTLRALWTEEIEKGKSRRDRHHLCREPPQQRDSCWSKNSIKGIICLTLSCKIGSFPTTLV